MVKVEHVTMRFRMVNDKVMSLKEYVVAVLKRRLQYKEFTVLMTSVLMLKKAKSSELLDVMAQVKVLY